MGNGEGHRVIDSYLLMDKSIDRKPRLYIMEHRKSMLYY